MPASRKATAPLPATEPAVPQFRGHRVPIVDDNPDAAEALRMQLEAMGAIEVCAVLDGKQALRRGPEFQPDVVLLDLGMPDMDGVEVARRLRQEPWGQHVMLVAVTGWGQDEHWKRTKAAGSIGTSSSRPPAPTSSRCSHRRKRCSGGAAPDRQAAGRYCSADSTRAAGTVNSAIAAPSRWSGASPVSSRQEDRNQRSGRADTAARPGAA